MLLILDMNLQSPTHPLTQIMKMTVNLTKKSALNPKHPRQIWIGLLILVSFGYVLVPLSFS